VDEVELRAGGAELCSLTQKTVDAAAFRSSVRRPDYLYFVDAKDRLVRIPAGSSDTKPDPAPGALGEGDTALRSVAVSRDEHTAAGVSLDGKSLYVGSLVSGGSLGEPVLRSHGRTEADRLTNPSWDAQDGLWVADRDPDNPRLLLLEEGKGDPLEVRVPHLDGRIQAVRVAADGVRIALVVEKGGKKTLLIGLIEREGKPGEQPAVRVVELRSATPELEEITAMSWAGDSRLVVVGREHGGVEQMRYVQVDGSTPDVPAPAALTGVKEVTAAEDDQLPLVAYSVDGIVQLPSGGQWQKVTEGTAPVYPGCPGARLWARSLLPGEGWAGGRCCSGAGRPGAPQGAASRGRFAGLPHGAVPWTDSRGRPKGSVTHVGDERFDGLGVVHRPLSTGVAGRGPERHSGGHAGVVAGPHRPGAADRVRGLWEASYGALP
jgi:hypothetical protein